MPVGNYKKKSELDLSKAPSSTAAPAKLSPSGTVAESVKQGLQSDVSEAGTVADRALTYEQVLEAVELTREKALQILDAVLLEDFYEETLPVTEKATVTFRTRTRQDTVRFYQNLEVYQPRYESQREESRQRYNLAASLVAFRGTTFEHPASSAGLQAIEAAFQLRMDYVCALSEPVVDRLVLELHKFDKRVFAALNEGAVEFF